MQLSNGKRAPGCPGYVVIIIDLQHDKPINHYKDPY